MLGVYVLGSVVINGSPLLGSYLETWWTRRHITPPPVVAHTQKSPPDRVSSQSYGCLLEPFECHDVPYWSYFPTTPLYYRQTPVSSEYTGSVSARYPAIACGTVPRVNLHCMSDVVDRGRPTPQRRCWDVDSGKSRAITSST